MNSRILRTLIFFGILAVGFLTTAFMMLNRITPEKAPVEEHVTPVTVQSIEHGARQVKITGHGTVTPDREVRLLPEVSGRITDMNKMLIPGGILPRGAMLVSIDQRDYKAQYDTRKEQVTRAALSLKQEQARQAVAREEWELLGKSIPEDEANQELALRIPQIESAQAALAAAESVLSKAELDLERCTVRSPFNALVIRENVDPGQVVNPQTELAVLAGTDRFRVMVSVPVEYLPWITAPEKSGKGSEAKIIQKAGSKNIIRKGQVIRLLGDLDTNGRLARLLVAVDDPLNLDNKEEQLPLLLGSYVTVEISGKTMADVAELPRSAVRNLEEAGAGGLDDEALWVMDKDGRLKVEPVKVAWRMPDSVFVSTDLRDGTRVVTSSIATPVNGMKLTLETVDSITSKNRSSGE